MRLSRLFDFVFMYSSTVTFDKLRIFTTNAHERVKDVHNRSHKWINAGQTVGQDELAAGHHGVAQSYTRNDVLYHHHHSSRACLRLFVCTRTFVCVARFNASSVYTHVCVHVHRRWGVC